MYSAQSTVHSVQCDTGGQLIGAMFQVEATMSSAVMVVFSGGGASHALWLPRGATLILLAPVAVKDDFVLWAHLSHLNVRWIEIGTLNTPFPYDTVLEQVAEGLQHYSRHGVFLKE